MKIHNKNGFPYSICVLFAPGVVILLIKLPLASLFGVENQPAHKRSKLLTL